MWGFSVLAQESAILIYAGFLGLEIGLVYDGFRIIRRVWNCPMFVIAVMDLVFWGFVAVRTFSVMHTYSNGTLRWFAIFGVMVIWGLYMKLLSRLFIRIGVSVLSGIRFLFAKPKKLLTKILKLFIMKL